ncbi:MAG: PD40 domain-containing protein [Sphingobacteriaceae bacterium]|nr:PD40 domain-containing protein [Sphingobacteriaceae bacterium]
MKKFSYIIIFLLAASFSFAQKKGFGPPTVDDADEHFKHDNYLMAIPIYRSELKKDPKNNKIRLKLGICYIRTKISREEPIKYLEQYVKDPKCEEEGWLHLGKAYHLNNRINDAITAYEKYKTLKPKKAEEADRLIEQCKNAEKFINNPVNVAFQNLGKDVNSDEPDYYPFVSSDENFLVFTSRRKEGIGGKKVEVDGYHPSDIFISNVENGKWGKAQNIGRNINGSMDEQAVGLKSDGLELYVYEDHIDKFGDLYISTRKDTKTDFSKPKICDPLINEKIETSGCLSEDGMTMFFARRDKVESTSDIYVCRKLPNNKWALPQKLPEIINTKYNEDFPYLLNDGVTLYFASEGHNSMGGYDLFRTTWNIENNTFSKPENLGFPVNSTDDDRNICVTPDDRVAYISAFRNGGQGDLDIYRIKFNDHDQLARLYVGKVFYGDSLSPNQPKNVAVQIFATNKKTKYEYLYTPHTKTGRFVMNLPVGKYAIRVIAEGYEEYTDDISISDIGKTESYNYINYVLRKK